MLTHDTFAGLENEKFKIQGINGQQVELVLEELSEITTLPSHENFSILFRGSNEVFLTEGTYPFNHESTGPFDLFIVPIAQDANGFVYQSVFNRLRQPENSSAGA